VVQVVARRQTPRRDSSENSKNGPVHGVSRLLLLAGFPHERFAGASEVGVIPRLLSPEEVARACGLSRRAVYRAIERGELPAARLCSRLRIRHEDLQRWIERNAVETPPPPQPPVTDIRRIEPHPRGSFRARLKAIDGKERPASA
jgi:excisionase family DNA binding protein